MTFSRMASHALLTVLGGLSIVQGCTRGKTMVELNEAAAGQPIKTQVGQRLRITLAENRTTGYHWQVAGDCAQILAQEDDEATPGASNMPGAPGQRAWVFAARTAGNCELRFESVRPWETTATGKTVSFPVTVAKAG